MATVYCTNWLDNLNGELPKRFTLATGKEKSNELGAPIRFVKI